jgi:hypothetical protein
MELMMIQRFAMAGSDLFDAAWDAPSGLENALVDNDRFSWNTLSVD